MAGFKEGMPLLGPVAPVPAIGHGPTPGASRARSAQPDLARSATVVLAGRTAARSREGPRPMHPMKNNVGLSDRAIRLFFGLTLLGLGIALDSPWGLIGIVPMVTAGLGYCPLYPLLGIDTCEDTH